jgi:hypothetical protein
LTVGNVADPRAQVVTAAGMGAAAAFAINHDLVGEEVAGAVSNHPAHRRAVLSGTAGPAVPHVRPSGGRRGGR